MTVVYAKIAVVGQRMLCALQSVKEAEEAISYVNFVTMIEASISAAEKCDMFV